MAGFYCTLPIPGDTINIYFCNIILSSHRVATSFIGLTCWNRGHFVIYISMLILEDMGKHRITTIDVNDMKK